MFKENLGLRVCRRTENGKIRVIHEFDTFDEFFRFYYDERAFPLYFVNNPDIRIKDYSCRRFSDFPGLYCYGKIVYDKYGRLYTVDYLVGLNRKWKAGRPRQFWGYRFDCGHKRVCYGHLRHMKTTQEIRQSVAITEDEKEVNIQPRRGRHNIPTLWDDIWVKPQKSWKWQSKRRHQWRPK